MWFTFVGIMVLPCVLMAMGLVYAIRGVCRADAKSRSAFLYPLICAIVLSGGYTAWMLQAILTSRSSTAGIGFMLLPISALVIGGYGFLIPRLLLKRVAERRHSAKNDSAKKK